MMMYPSGPEAATSFLKFVNASPTPFHAVHNAALRLKKAGFQKVGFRTDNFIPFLINCSADSRERRLGEGSSTWGEILFHEVRFGLFCYARSLDGSAETRQR
jgi:hypothetical protein